MRNLNLIFHKLYYRCAGTSEYHSDVRELTGHVLDATFNHKRDYRPMPAATHSLILRVCYPGLVTGLGSTVSAATHEDIDVDFNLDHTTGQPVVYGWTIKGQLRSHFHHRAAAVAEIAGLPIETVKALEKDIFEDNDVFFDAVLFDGDDHGKVLGLDFFCRHRAHRPMMGTIPVRVMKLLPNVRLEFRFRLHDGILTADEKLALIKELLLVFGIGARTNVGYGYLREADTRLFEQTSRERVRCPRCGASNYKYHPNGNIRNKCYKCREYFPKINKEVSEGEVSDE